MYGSLAFSFRNCASVRATLDGGGAVIDVRCERHIDDGATTTTSLERRYAQVIGNNLAATRHVQGFLPLLSNDGKPTWMEVGPFA